MVFKEKEEMIKIREAREQYKELRNSLICKTLEYMEETGQKYTSRELSEMTGLSSQCISTLFNCSDNYSENYLCSNGKLFKGGLHKIPIKVTERYVKLDQNGEPDFDRVITITREKLAYRVL